MKGANFGAAWKALRGTEKRSYTDLSVSAMLARAQGVKGDPRETAAAQTAAGILGRSLAAAKVEPDTPASRALTPKVLYSMGRSLILEGESVWFIETDGGGAVSLRRAVSWDIAGTVRRWIYAVDLAGPTGSERRVVPADGVVHVRLNEDPAQPWRGRSPFAEASASSRLAGAVEGTLANEAEAGSGQLIPAPIAGMDKDDLSELRKDLREAADGKPMLVPAWEDSYQSPDAKAKGAAQTDWKQRKIGFQPDQWSVALREDLADSLLSAAGVPVDLATGGATTTARRESWRQWLHGAVDPVARILADEFRAKLEPGLSLEFGRLFASDISGRARAFGSLVASGMDVERAAGLSGLLQTED